MPQQFGLKMSVKKMFFDRKAVTSRLSKAKQQVLSRAGGLVRKIAKRSIRKRRRVSTAGKQPSSHTGALRKWILYGYDRTRESVVVGPTLLPGREGKGALPALEYGGTSTRVNKRGKRKTQRVRPRPYMRPALEQVQSQLPKMWRDSIR